VAGEQRSESTKAVAEDCEPLESRRIQHHGGPSLCSG
jgi:hypothetical protein